MISRPSLTPPMGVVNDATERRNIVCCIRWGPKYGRQYSDNLYAMVGRYIKEPHEFWLFTDDPQDTAFADRVLDTDVLNKHGGWWTKLGLFTTDVFPMGARILFLDLDLVITNDISWMLNVAPSDGPLIMVENFQPNWKYCPHNSSVMQWVAGDDRLKPIGKYDESMMKTLHGDQDWIWRALRNNIANWSREKIISYKYDVKKGVPANSADIVLFHGDPKPHQVKDMFVREHWR